MLDLDRRWQAWRESLQAWEDALGAELAQQRRRFRYTLIRHRVRFEREIRRLHREQRIAWWDYLRKARPAVVLTAPIIYGLLPFFLLMDLAVTLYQAICFPIYGIQKAKRADFMANDRGHLAYLNIIERVNCLYCGYANGVARYVREVASRTEQYWCPIKHTRHLEGVTDRYWAFLDYGDAPRWPQDLEDLRRALREDAVLDEVHFSAASAAENQSASAADGASEKDRV